MQKGITTTAIIIIIACVVIAGLGGFFGWKAYQVKKEERLTKEAEEIAKRAEEEMLPKEVLPPEEEIAEVDTDGDGLTDKEEVKYDTDLNNPDTDGDGYSDKIEIDTGYDPLVAAEKPTEEELKEEEEVAEWKTYTNEKHGYEVNLPQNWGQISEYDGSFGKKINPEASFLLLGKKYVTLPTIPQSMEIGVYEDLSIEKWLEIYMKDKEYQSKVVKIDSLEATEVIWDQTSHFLLEKDKDLYEIVRLKNLETVNRILSTFKFTKPAEEKEEVPAVFEEEQVRNTVEAFMDIRIQRDELGVKEYLTDTAKQAGYDLVGTTDPDYNHRCEILKITKADDKYTAKVKIHESYLDMGEIGYFEETHTLVKENNVWKVDKIEHGTYHNI